MAKMCVNISQFLNKIENIQFNIVVINDNNYQLYVNMHMSATQAYTAMGTRTYVRKMTQEYLKIIVIIRNR